MTVALAALDEAIVQGDHAEEKVRVARQQIRDAVRAALEAGVDHEDLVGRPYSRGTVLQIAREAGLKVRRGPRPRALQ